MKISGACAVPAAQRFEQFERACGVDREILGRIVEAGGYGDLRGEMKHGAGFRDGVAQPGCCAHIRDLDPYTCTVRGAKPAQIAFGTGPREAVVNDDRPPLAQHPVGQIGADEAGAAGDQDRLALGRRRRRPDRTS